MKRALPIFLTLIISLIVFGPVSAASAKGGSSKQTQSKRAALKIDRNRSGIPDVWERKFQISTKADQSQLDLDDDGLNNIEEYNGGTNPRVDDTDGNGILDGDEDGVVVSFNSTTGLLRVLMPGGHKLRGIVDEDTMVFCEPDVQDPGDSTGATDPAAPGPTTDLVDPSASDPSLFDTECGSENLLPGAKLLYVDTDGMYFTDVTLDESPLAVVEGN